MNAGTLYLNNCALIDCTVASGNVGLAVFATDGAIVDMQNCYVSNNVAKSGIYTQRGAVVHLTGCTVSDIAKGTFVLAGRNTLNSVTGVVASDTVTISSGASINLTSSIAPGGGIQVIGGTCTVNGNVIESGTYTSIDSNGMPT